MKEVVAVEGLVVRVQRSDRRRTINFTIERDGSVVASIPTQLPLSTLEHAVSRKALWLHGSLARRGDLNSVRVEKEYVSGEGFYYLGRKYRLRVIRSVEGELAEATLRFRHGHFELEASAAAKGRDVFIDWYTEHAYAWIEPRLVAIRRRVGVKQTELRVCDLGYRWGSCSRVGRLNFHWRTILLPPAIADYVLLHEVCHVCVHNHSDQFWALMRRYDMDFESKRRWLAANGGQFDL